MESPGKLLSRGRRLFELLEEQQEPFLLEVYLAENGRSWKLLKTQEDSIKCWQSGTCKKFLGLGSHGFKRGRGRRRWSCIMPDIWPWKLRKTLKLENRVTVNGSRRIFSCFTAMGSEAKADRFSRLLYSCEEVLKTMEDSKQFSPVSVFELHSDEDCSAQNHSMEEDNPSTSTKDSGECEESHSSSCFSDLKQHKNGRNESLESKQQPLLYSKELEARNCGSHESLSHDKAAKPIEVQFCSLNVSKLSELMDVDLTGREWKQFQTETIEVGFKIECFIFDEIREEVVVEMLGSLVV